MSKHFCLWLVYSGIWEHGKNTWELYPLIKWEKHAKAIPGRSCYISETATKLRDFDNVQDKFKSYSLLLHFT